MESRESVVLVTRRAGSAGTAGIAALRHGRAQCRLLHRDVLDALVETLATHGVLAAVRDWLSSDFMPAVR